MVRSFFAQFDYLLNKLPDEQVTWFPNTSFRKETARQARKDGSLHLTRCEYVHCEKKTLYI
jgi:hypothetical protein